MTAIRHLLALVAAAGIATTASAQFVKGNEAVRVLPDGTKKVETPPTGGALLSEPCCAMHGGQERVHGGGMVDGRNRTKVSMNVQRHLRAGAEPAANRATAR